MEALDIVAIAIRGQHAHHLFRANLTEADSLVAEMVAFSNSGGGRVFVGIEQDGTFSALSKENIDHVKQLVSDAVAHFIHPPIDPSTETVSAVGGFVLVVSIVDGISKPYTDNDRNIWVKNGLGKRKVTSREELQKMYQVSQVLHGEEALASGLTSADLDTEYLAMFFHRNFGRLIDTQTMSVSALLQHMNLMQGDRLNMSGALLFAKNPHFKLPAFIVRASAYSGVEVNAEKCIESRDISGKIGDQFYKSMGFVLAYLGPEEKVGKSTVPQVVLEELIANALLHRDYFVSTPIRICIFHNRIEVISPGHLPRKLTVENIKHGNAHLRNPILVSFGRKLLPYRGLENGIIRALKAYPHIEFRDDREGNTFKATIRFPALDKL